MSYFSQSKAVRDKAHVAAAGPGGGAATAKNSMTGVSTIGPGMLITGNIVCEGSAQIFGRVMGDIEAVEVMIGEGAQAEGNITAYDVLISGAFRGAIRGNSVKLKGAATVDGEVFSRSLTVEENVQFEGVSRRLDKPVELPSSARNNGMKPTLVTAEASSAISGTAA